MVDTGDIDPVAAFCADLRRRLRASHRDVAGVAREIALSRTQLYAILNGEIKRPPEYATVVRPLIRACGGTEAELADWRRRHEVLVGVHAATRRRPVPRIPAPFSLPADVTGFTGREAELAALATATAPVVAVTGPPGCGKTALVVQWAHRSAGAFPDGRLYVNLRGYDRAEDAVAPAAAIRALLDALGVEASAVPPGTDRQAALWRSRTAGRRMLVVLDNARDADQVLPLLAGDPLVRTVITSRNRLSGLTAEVGAEPLRVGPPDHAEAVALLRRRAALRAGDDQALEAIVTACGRLPLALALVAGRLRETGFAPATVVAELRRPMPAVLDGARTVFAWSYRALSPSAARLFRLLGTIGGGDMGVPAVAAVAGTSRPGAERLLRELTAAGLLDEPAPGRYEMPDLLRGYARDQAPARERQAALTRLLNHYTGVAHEADLVLNPSRPPIPLAVVDGAEEKPALDVRAAREWLTTERAVLLAALRQAHDEGLHRHAWQLGWALDTFLNEEHRWQDEGAAWAVALRAATALVDPPAVAHAHRFVAVVAGRLDRFREAHDHMREALEISRAAGDAAGEAETLYVLSYLYWLQGDHGAALEHVERSQDLWARLGRSAWAGKAEHAVGWYHAQLGDHPRAVKSYLRALADLQVVGDRANEIVVRDTLGQAYHAVGDFDGAAAQFDAALRMARATNDPAMQAWLWVHQGDLAETAGSPEAAAELWAQAYASLAAMRHPYAAGVAAKLATTDDRGAGSERTRRLAADQ